MNQGENPTKTKIVATLGPASSSEKMIGDLAEEGVTIFRLNFSHGTQEDHLNTIKNIRSVERRTGRKLTILQDLQGPKIRLGRITNGKVVINDGDELVITSRCIEGSREIVSITFPEVLKDVKKGDRIFINDGLIRLFVEDVTDDSVRTRVLQGGEISDHKGLNFPDSRLSISAISDKDFSDLAFGLKEGVDAVALSFVKTGENVKELRAGMSRLGRIVPIVAKIERWEAVENIEDIIGTADAIMVARGDLGTEMPIEKIPIIQKEVISLCNSAGKPVITATQMLNSLVTSLTPTRAEVTDISNAIFDGTDAVMLSNETAIGKYPVEAVRVMRSIIEETEKSCIFVRHLYTLKDTFEGNVTDAIAFSATELAKLTSSSLVICATESGKTASLISKHKPCVPVLALTPRDSTVRMLNLKWGVYPFLVRKFESVDEILSEAPKIALSLGLLKKGETYIITAGSHTGVSGSTNLLKVDIA